MMRKHYILPLALIAMTAGGIALSPALAERRSPAADARSPQALTIAYGEDRLQQLDFYAARGANGPAPLVLFVHGGGWKRGDKGNATGQFKAPHYTGLGYNFASINYRLVPDATVEQQAGDVAHAVAGLLSRADELGIDRSRVVLMGHSAGAHLVTLVGTDPRYLRSAGLQPRDVAGIIPIDGACYDVPQQMEQAGRFMQRTYRAAFGTERARQWALSPVAHAALPNVANFLIIHVGREDGIAQAKELQAALDEAGTSAERQQFPGEGLEGHGEINRRLGDPDYPATPVVDRWLARLFR